jgi:hypothetical protein
LKRRRRTARSPSGAILGVALDTLASPLYFLRCKVTRFSEEARMKTQLKSVWIWMLVIIALVLPLASCSPQRH